MTHSSGTFRCDGNLLCRGYVEVTHSAILLDGFWRVLYAIKPLIYYFHRISSAVDFTCTWSLTGNDRAGNNMWNGWSRRRSNCTWGHVIGGGKKALIRRVQARFVTILFMGENYFSEQLVSAADSQISSKPWDSLGWKPWKLWDWELVRQLAIKTLISNFPF